MKKADALLESVMGKIREGSWPPEPRLPTVRQLARDWQTSTLTVQAVLKELEKNALVERYPGRKRYYLPGSQDLPLEGATLRILQPRFLKISFGIRAEILSGACPPGYIFPSLQSMQAHYGCSHPTLHAAFTRLQASGLIKQVGKRYVVVSPPAPPPRRSLVHFIGHPRVLDDYHNHMLVFLKAVEGAIQALQWGRLELWVAEKPHQDWFTQAHEVAGYLHIPAGTVKPWTQFFSRQRHIPLVIIDTSERSMWRFRVKSNFYRIILGNRKAGWEMGRFLNSLGHTYIAFLSHMGLDPGWPRLRYEGLLEIFGPVSKEKIGNWRLRLFMGGTETGPLGLPEAETLFAKALEDANITAWVCINDEMADLAMNYLTRRGISVPERISLVGFDNSPRAYRLGLTSFDFAFDALGRKAIQCLANPSLVLRDEDGFISVTGQVIPRASAGPPPNKKSLSVPESSKPSARIP